MKKILGFTPVFISLYLLCMIPTYVLPYLGSNSTTANAIAQANEYDGITMAFYIHLGCLLFMVLLGKFRGI